MSDPRMSDPVTAAVLEIPGKLDLLRGEVRVATDQIKASTDRAIEAERKQRNRVIVRVTVLIVAAVLVFSGLLHRFDQQAVARDHHGVCESTNTARAATHAAIVDLFAAIAPVERTPADKQLLHDLETATLARLVRDQPIINCR